MSKGNELYRPSMISGSYFNQMLSCGDWYNPWVENALRYLPREILDEHKEALYFVSMGHRDGTRLARNICENREVIVLSEHILPKRGANEGQPEVRYFIYVVLHEVAHAIRKHKSPIYDTLSQEVCQTQEDEADELAMQWFNDHVVKLNNPYLPLMTIKEIANAQARNQELMERQYNGA